MWHNHHSNTGPQIDHYLNSLDIQTPIIKISTVPFKMLLQSKEPNAANSTEGLIKSELDFFLEYIMTGQNWLLNIMEC